MARTVAAVTAFALTLFAILAIHTSASAAPDPHYLACGKAAELPMTVTLDKKLSPNVARITREAMAEWNRFAGREVFVEVPERGRTYVQPADDTWVSMPCKDGKAVVSLGKFQDLEVWTAHELGHTLGLADHLRAGDDPTNYLNPGHCPEDGYSGIMSYCTPRGEWFGAGDREMFDTLWPRPAGPAARWARFVPQVARD